MIPTDPTSTLAASDFKNFRAAVTHLDPKLKKDALDHYEERLQKIKKKDGTIKYPNKPARDAQLTEFAGYQDSELGGYARLGNSLQDTNPASTPGNPTGRPPTLAELRANPALRPNVEVTLAGTITHTDPVTGAEIHEAHEYMHEIFDYILYESRAKLEAINVKLQEYSKTPNATTRAAYEAAVNEAERFKGTLPAPVVAPGATPSPFANAISEIKFKPVVTNEGFTVSLRIQIRWYNPRHSSSTISVP